MSTLLQYVEFLDTRDKKANHRAPIVRVLATHPIAGADKIERIELEDYPEISLVSQKGQFSAGTLGVYIFPDSIVPQTEPFAFIWGPYQDPTDPVGLDPAKAVPASKRRITVRRFKGVWSEGLLMPLSDFGWVDPLPINIALGEDVSDLLDITHYDPDAEIAGGNNKLSEDAAFRPRRAKRRPSTLKGWFFYLLHKLHVKRNEKFLVGPQVSTIVYDIDNLKSYSRAFVEGELVRITEKIHGSSARFINVDGTLYAGSRKQWVNPHGAAYPALALNHNPWIADWCEKNQGYSLYGEVTPRQKGYSYGTSNTARFWLFDILDPEGYWLPSSHPIYMTIPAKADLVPMLYQGPFDQDLIKSLVDGPTTTDGKHLREGVVIEGNIHANHQKLKLVSNKFLESVGAMTDTDYCLVRTMAQTRVEIAAGLITLRPLTVKSLERRIDLLLIEEPRTWDDADEE